MLLEAILFDWCGIMYYGIFVSDSPWFLFESVDSKIYDEESNNKYMSSLGQLNVRVKLRRL